MDLLQRWQEGEPDNAAAATSRLSRPHRHSSGGLGGTP